MKVLGDPGNPRLVTCRRSTGGVGEAVVFFAHGADSMLTQVIELAMLALPLASVGIGYAVWLTARFTAGPILGLDIGIVLLAMLQSAGNRMHSNLRMLNLIEPLRKSLGQKYPGLGRRGIHVGIGFAETPWYLNSSSHWDIGFLEVVPGSIRFWGRDWSFALPASRIRTAELVETDRRHHDLALILCWGSHSGHDEWIYVELREEHSIKKEFDRMQALIRQLARASSAPDSVEDAERLDPPGSSQFHPELTEVEVPRGNMNLAYPLAAAGVIAIVATSIWLLLPRASFLICICSYAAYVRFGILTPKLKKGLVREASRRGLITRKRDKS